MAQLDSIKQHEALVESAASEPDDTPQKKKAIVTDALPLHSVLTMSNVVMATLAAVGIGFLFILLYQFYMVVFIFFIGISLSIAMKPAVQLLNRYNVPPRLSIIAIYGILATAIGFFLWLVIPLIATQIANMVVQLPEYYHTLYGYLNQSSSALIRSLADLLPLQLTMSTDAIQGEESTTNSFVMIWEWLSNGANGGLLLIVVLLLAYHWTLEGNSLIQRGLWRISPQRRETVSEFIQEMEESIGGYVRGQTILCVVIGVASGLAFWVLSVPNAITLGLILGVLEAVPLIGPLLGAVPAVLITLSTAPEKTLWVILILTAIQVLENNLLVPRIMDESVGVNAIVSILAISAFGLLFGVLGAILAIPLAAILQILLNRLIFQKAEAVAEEVEATDTTARGRYSVLRVRAQDLARDVRSQARSEENKEGGSRIEEEATDRIEMLALELDTLLARKERVGQ